jgi:ssDNA-binding Zn-finger/Zn-ribbon topoisomerase 1
MTDGQTVAVSCPNCGVATKMVVRTNDTTGKQFLGCPNYPQCKAALPLPTDLVLKEAGQMPLF